MTIDHRTPWSYSLFIALPLLRKCTKIASSLRRPNAVDCSSSRNVSPMMTAFHLVAAWKPRGMKMYTESIRLKISGHTISRVSLALKRHPRHSMIQPSRPKIFHSRFRWATRGVVNHRNLPPWSLQRHRGQFYVIRKGASLIRIRPSHLNRRQPPDAATSAPFTSK